MTIDILWGILGFLTILFAGCIGCLIGFNLFEKSNEPLNLTNKAYIKNLKDYIEVLEKNNDYYRRILKLKE